MPLNNSEEKASDFLGNMFRRTFTDVRVLRNVLMRLPATEGLESAEFDTIVVCNAGVYCFEIKNWNNCEVVREKQDSGLSNWFLDYGEEHRVKVADPVAQGGLKVRALKSYFESQVQIRYYVFLPSLSVRLGPHIPTSILCAQDLPYMARMSRHYAKHKAAKPLMTADEVSDVSFLIEKLSDGLTLDVHIASCMAYEERKKLRLQKLKLDATVSNFCAVANIGQEHSESEEIDLRIHEE